MKVVGFEVFKKEKKKRKHIFFCVSNVFRNSVMIMGITTALLVVGLINKNFSLSLKECIDNFVSSMANVKNIFANLFIG